MKGRTACPKCNYEFVLDIPEDKEKHEVVCPKCKSKFSVKFNNKETECSWEEHGEPRKTILSSIRPKTKLPIIAAVLLLCVFATGITTAVFSETFITSSLSIAEGLGLTGEVEITVQNISNKSIANATITINDQCGKTDENGIFYINNIEPGMRTVKINKTNFKTNTLEIMVAPVFKSENKVILKEGAGVNEKVKFDTTGCSFILAIFSCLSLIGFIACLKRQNFDVAIAGSLIGIFSFGFFLIASIIAIIAFVIIMKSRDEFENGKKGKVF